MDKKDFFFDLPKELIAQTPLKSRDNSRLLCVPRFEGAFEHRTFNELPGLLRKGDLLVFNDSRVLPARLFGKRESGGSVEVLLLRLCQGDGSLDTNYQLSIINYQLKQWLCMVRPGKKAGIGTVLTFGDGEMTATVKDVLPDGNRIVEFSCEGDFFDIIGKIGKMPLPPYIHEQLEDSERYQTVYSKTVGSAAAPTAGLHFTDKLLSRLDERGILAAYLTLHVGQGTFVPVKSEKIEDHVMHSEYFSIDGQTAEIINHAKKSGGRVIAVGTTSCRVLESVAGDDGMVEACSGDTDIFIYPGYRFKCIDGLITNFHLPESTLIMLVSAFAGRERILSAYEEAIAKRYRFFSFGDAMMIV